MLLISFSRSQAVLLPEILPLYFLISGVASSWIKQMMVATSSVEMTGMCRSGGREKAELSVVAAEGSFGSAEHVGMAC